MFEVSPEQRLSILKTYGLTVDRLVREDERKSITSISRSRAWELENQGKFPRAKNWVLTVAHGCFLIC
jgi:hypothetical protein